MSARRPFVRPMSGWWRRNPYFVRYMVREATAFFVAAYAFVLLAGLVCLARGEGAWNAWLDAVRSPAGIALHAVLFAAFVVHTWTWFAIMPKTLPALRLAGRRVPAAAITAGGLAAAAVASIALVLLARGP